MTEPLPPRIAVVLAAGQGKRGSHRSGPFSTVFDGVSPNPMSATTTYVSK